MKKGRRRLRALGWTAAVIVLLWTGLTIWVEMEGPAKWIKLGSSTDSLKILVVYDPDPIYDLDQQICNQIGKGISERNSEVVIATVAATHEKLVSNFDAVVLCANTYNWRPDWSITEFIKSNPGLEKIPVAAITIGSGSTSASHRSLNKLLASRNIDVIDQHEWWLMRPNDEARIEESTIQVANDEAYQFGRRFGNEIRLLLRKLE